MKSYLTLFSVLLLSVLSLPVHSAETGEAKDAAPAAAHHGMDVKESSPSPAPGSEKTPPVSGNLSGTVLQTMDSAGYSYVYLETADQRKVWVALPQMKVKTGDKLTVKSGAEMQNFTSSTLKRTFDKIIFSDGLITSSGSAGEEKSPGAGGAVVASGKVKIEKATGANAYTVAELFSKAAKLHKKKIAVRGKVVKVSSNIMSRNWIHLQDGTGSSKKGTNNVVVTSKNTPTVGDVVTARGVLFKDRDFGGNYKYKVIIEEATVGQ